MNLSERKGPDAGHPAPAAHDVCQDCNPPCALTRLVSCQDLALWAWASGPEDWGPEHRRGAALLIKDRYFTANALDEHGLPVTPFALPSEFAGFREAMEALEGPFVARSRMSEAGWELPELLFADAADSEAESRWRVLDDRWMLQGRAAEARLESVVHPGPEVTDYLLRFRGGIPGHGIHGSGTARLQGPIPPDVDSLTVRAVSALGLSGPATMVLERSPEGTLRVMDVHAHLGFLCVDSAGFLASLEVDRRPGPDGWNDVETPDWLLRVNSHSGLDQRLS